MKLLLDENIHVKFKYRLLEKGFEVSTVFEKKWNAKKNGELLRLMIEEGYTHLITFDKNLPLQQNFNSLPIPVIVISAPYNTNDMIMEMYNEIIDAITMAEVGLNTVKYIKKEK